MEDKLVDNSVYFHLINSYLKMVMEDN